MLCDSSQLIHTFICSIFVYQICISANLTFGRCFRDDFINLLLFVQVKNCINLEVEVLNPVPVVFVICILLIGESTHSIQENIIGSSKKTFTSSINTIFPFSSWRQINLTSFANKQTQILFIIHIKPYFQKALSKMQLICHYITAKHQLAHGGSDMSFLLHSSHSCISKNIWGCMCCKFT